MKRPAAKPPARSSTPEKFTWPFTRRNLVWFLVAVAVIVVGYIFLAQGPYDSFSSRTMGPILLVIGYIILLPISLLVRTRREG